jgi:3-dehydroquinate synthase
MAAGQLLNMFDFEVSSKSGNYRISTFLSSREFDNVAEYVLLQDSNVQVSEFLSTISRVIKVEGNEKIKTLAGSEEILLKLASLSLKKNQTLIACGGGAVQDVCTLVSSIYMRGVNWIYVPTTLMAMMDSCIGGKSSINVGSIKNLAGNFYPPSTIIIDPKYIKTLSRSAIVCGFLEAVKICYARNPDLASKFIDKARLWLSQPNEDALLELTEMSLRAKKWFIEIDEFDFKERKLLNFGHSFGHALESATNMEIPHGIAIGIGMIVAGEVSNRNFEILKGFIYDLFLWASFNTKDIRFDEIIFKNALLADKKNSQDLQRLVLLDESSELYLAELPISAQNLDSQVSTMKNILKGLQ